MWQQGPVQVDTEIPVWGIMVVVGGFIGAWFVALYKIAEMRKNLDTVDSMVRAMAQLTATLDERFEDHLKNNEERFNRLEDQLKEIRDDLKAIRDRTVNRR